MDKTTKYIVASNLTAAYFAGIEHRYIKNPRNGSWAATPTEQELAQPLGEVISVYHGFLKDLDLQYPESQAGQDAFNQDS